MGVVKFLFWNLNRGDLRELICELARAERIDVFLLVESGCPPWRIMEAINAERAEYKYGFTNCERLICLTRFDSRWMDPLLENDRVSIRKLQLPGRPALLVAAAHLPSKINFSADSQILEATELARMIEQVEAGEGHTRTVVMGDLNMNPFEPGVVGARGGLHAVMSRRVAARQSRTVQRQPYRFFYNPMWNHLGDARHAGGTFYYDGSEPVCYFWNMYDQVLLRPDLLENFAPEQVRILTEVGGVPLLTNGRPNSAVASDHLPVMLELEV